MRTFIALELPYEFQDETTALARQLSRQISGRFMKRETYHITLAFLGETNEETAQQVIDTLEQTVFIYRRCQSGQHEQNLVHETGAETQNITLIPKGLGKFGKPQDATVFLELQQTDRLSFFVKALRQELTERNITFDQKKFRPHITLARRAKISSNALPQLVFPKPAFASNVTFYRSILTHEGAHYKSLYSVSLAN